MMKIEAILRDEMDRIGGQEISMPVVQPADLWKETGRWYQIGPEMGRFSDRNERDMVLAMTHEKWWLTWSGGRCSPTNICRG